MFQTVFKFARKIFEIKTIWLAATTPALISKRRFHLLWSVSFFTDWL